VSKNRTYSTDFSFADWYIEDRKKGKYWRVQVNYPYVNDRRAANIDYSAESERRTWRGSAPLVPQDRDKITIRKPFSFDSSQYLFISDANAGSNIPEGYYGTSSGIFPIDFIPFSQGTPTDNPVEVDGDFDNTTTSGEFFIARNIETSQMLGIVPYYPLTGDGFLPGRFEWDISPNFKTAVFPQVRYPSGAVRKRFFR